MVEKGMNNAATHTMPTLETNKQTLTINLYYASHKTCSLKQLGEIIKKKKLIEEKVFKKSKGIVVLSTCNRFEIYVDADELGEIERIIKEELDENYRFIKKMEGKDVAEHLFRVAGGLDSQIIGENEILGQVKKAWIKAKNDFYTTRKLDLLFHRAIIAGKRIQAETNIGKGVKSYPSLAAYVFMENSSNMNTHKVMVVGTGQAARLFLKELCNANPNIEVIIVGRNPDRLHTNCKKESHITIEELTKFSEEVDGVFVATNTKEPFLSTSQFKNARIIVDISIPHTIKKDDNKRVLFLEDLKELVPKISLEHELKKAERIIEEELKKLEKDILKEEMNKIISQIMNNINELMKQEIHTTLTQISKKKPIEKVILDAFNSYTKSIMRPVFLFMRDAYFDGNGHTTKLLAQYFLKKNE